MSCRDLHAPIASTAVFIPNFSGAHWAAVDLAELSPVWTVQFQRGRRWRKSSEAVSAGLGIVRDNYYKQDFDGQDWNLWRNRFDGRLATIEDAHKSIDTMLASLNNRGYTKLVRISELSLGEDGIPYFGVGLRLGRFKNGDVRVAKPLDESPAAKAGIEGGWLVEKVDGKYVKGWDIDDIARLIRGPIDTSVSLEFRTQNNERRTISLKRAIVTPQAIWFSSKLDREIGYIRLDSLLDPRLTAAMRSKLASWSSDSVIRLHPFVLERLALRRTQFLNREKQTVTGNIR